MAITDWDRKLITACKTNDLAMATQAIANGADVNAENRRHETPLYCAVWNADGEIIDLLLDGGASAQLDVEDRPPQDHATRRVKGNPGLAKALTRLGYVFDPKDLEVTFLDSVEAGDVEAVQRACLHDPGLAVRLGDMHRQPIHIAAGSRRPEMVRALVELGADVNAFGGDYPSTPLMLACDEGDMETVRLLLELGADPDDVRDGDDHCGTPLHTAVRNRSKRLAEVLLRSGADPDKRDSYGTSARELAAEQGWDEFHALVAALAGGE